jgi:hypothetical protein
MKLQQDIPHPLAGKWVEVIGALYGTPWSNNIFWKDFDATMAFADLYPIQIPGKESIFTPVDNHIYSRFDPDDGNKKLIVPVTVDDGLMVSQSTLDFETELIAVLKNRYGDNITYQQETSQFCVSRPTRQPHGTITFDLYIMDTVTSAG